MKRIIPVILALAVLILALVSCTPEEVPTTTVVITSSTTTAKPKTSKVLKMGIDDKDIGWAFWAEN